MDMDKRGKAMEYGQQRRGRGVAWRGALERDRSMDSLFVPAYLFDTSTQGCLSVILIESETSGIKKR